MEFRVWMVVAASDDDCRKLVGDLAEKYAVSPQGSKNEMPLYSPVGGLTFIAFRVIVDGETQEEYNERYASPDADNEEVAIALGEEAAKANETLMNLIEATLKKRKLKWLSIVTNEREGETNFSVSAQPRDRFTVMEAL